MSSGEVRLAVRAELAKAGGALGYGGGEGESGRGRGGGEGRTRGTSEGAVASVEDTEAAAVRPP